MAQAAPGTLAYQQTELTVMEHVRHQVSARPRHLVNDHNLGSPNASRRTGERITIAGDVVEVTIKVALQDIDDIVGRRPSTIVSLVDYRAFFVLLRKVITIEAGIARLSRVWQIDVSELAV